VIGSYGLEECLDWTEQALASRRGKVKEGDGWLEGSHDQYARLRTAHRTSFSGSTFWPMAGTRHQLLGPLSSGTGH
jgi:hypothetical protein